MPEWYTSYGKKLSRDCLTFYLCLIHIEVSRFSRPYHCEFLSLINVLFRVTVENADRLTASLTLEESGYPLLSVPCAEAPNVILGLAIRLPSIHIHVARAILPMEWAS